MRKTLLLFIAISILFTVDLTAQCISANAGSDQTICYGSSATIGTAATTGYLYTWTPATGLNNPNIAQPVASPGATTTYHLTITPPPGTNLVTNGGFESGNTGFTSAYPYWPSSLYQNGYGTYLVGNSASLMYNYFFASPHTGNNMMVFDGGTGGASDVIWGQTISSITQNTWYRFSFFICNTTGGSLPMANIRASINGTTVVTGTAIAGTQGAWVRVQGLWNSGSNTTATISLVDLEGNTLGNDFAIDDIEFVSNCDNSATVTDDVIVTVSYTSPAISFSSATTKEGSAPAQSLNLGTNNVCYGWESSMLVTVNCNTANVTWYINGRQVTGGFADWDDIGIAVASNSSQTLTLYPGTMRNRDFTFVASSGSGSCVSYTSPLQILFTPTYYPGIDLVNGNYLGEITSKYTPTHIVPQVSLPSGSLYQYFFPTGVEYSQSSYSDPGIDVWVTDDFAGPSYSAAADKYYIPVEFYGGITMGCWGSYHLYIVVPPDLHRVTRRSRPLNSATTEQSNNKIGVYPNPAKDFIYVVTDGSMGESYKIEIYNAMGQMIKMKQVSAHDQLYTKLPVSDLPAGIYNVIIKSGQKVENKKIIVYK